MSKLFWEETCQGWNGRDWVENFRMSKEAFNRLCVELSPHISLKRDTNFRKAITVAYSASSSGDNIILACGHCTL